jgi:hypothetical protein
VSACCAGCTCSQPTPAMTLIEPVPEPAPLPFVAWNMYGVVLRDGLDRPPTLMKLTSPTRYDWHPGELVNGVAGITIQLSGDDPTGLSVKVIGTDPAGVHDTWHRVVSALAGKTSEWFGETEDVPF